MRKLADLLDKTPEIPLPADVIGIAWYLAHESDPGNAREALTRIPGWKRGNEFKLDDDTAAVAWNSRIDGVRLLLVTRPGVVPKLDGARDRTDQSPEAVQQRTMTRRIGEGLR